MNRRGDEHGEVLEVFSEETRFLKTYIGEVLENEDELTRGRCRISVPDLGWNTPAESPWMEPEYFGRGAMTPAVGDFVAVYFIAGDSNRPIYRSRLGEAKDTAPASYEGPDSHILYEDEDVLIAYDSASKTVTINGAEKITLNGDARKFVTHKELDDALQLLIIALNAHVHTSALPGSPTSAPTAAMSLDISAAATETILTGG